MTEELPVINFTRGVPAPESFPIEEMKVAATAALEQSGEIILQYGKAYGHVPLREWFAERNNINVEQVLTANSSLQIIDFICHQFLQPGDTVFTESPTYDRTVTLLRRHKAQVVDIELETDGLNIAALEAALENYSPKFFYIIPDFQNPMGATYSLEKRKQLLALAEQHDFWIIEDAPYRPLRFRGKEQPSCFELNPSRTMQIFSFTKLVGPGVRVSAIYGDADILAEMAQFAEDTYICPTMFSQGVVAEFCKRGQLEPQISKLKALYSPRLQACRDAITHFLPDAQATQPEGGFFLSLFLPEGVTTAAVLEKAKAYQLNLADGEAFFPNGGGERFLRLPYCALTPDEINEGIRRLAKAIEAI